MNVVLKKDRKVTSTEFERNLSPQLAAFPDARVSFQAQNGGGPDGDSRDIMLYLGGDDPDELTQVANQIAKEMATVPGLRAPRVGSQLAQPEITIKPRFDLAADLGVTTMALSQTIRIATLGDIEQNSASPCPPPPSQVTGHGWSGPVSSLETGAYTVDWRAATIRRN